VHFIKDCDILVLSKIAYHNPYGIYLKGSGIGVPGHFQIVVEKSAFMAYNMFNRTAGR
jgi:hypothetical protein